MINLCNNMLAIVMSRTVSSFMTNFCNNRSSRLTIAEVFVVCNSWNVDLFMTDDPLRLRMRLNFMNDLCMRVDMKRFCDNSFLGGVFCFPIGFFLKWLRCFFLFEDGVVGGQGRLFLAVIIESSGSLIIVYDALFLKAFIVTVKVDVFVDHAIVTESAIVRVVIMDDALFSMECSLWYCVDCG